MHSPTCILITGASSGIGAALAHAYAAPAVRLVLTGRDRARLDEVAATARTAGAEVVTAAIDVTDRAQLAHRIRSWDAERPFDLVIANAGLGGGIDGPEGESEAQARRLFAVNLDGVLNTIHPALGPMRARGRGQIALMASLAGYRGMPGAPAYSAAKAAVKAYGEGLRGAYAAEGIKISVICPGFVVSRMTAQNRFPMPFLMPAERAAAIIRRGLARDQGRIAFPWPMACAVALLAALPAALADRLTRRLPKKAAAGPQSSRDTEGPSPA